MEIAYHPIVIAFIEERSSFLEILNRYKDLDEVSRMMFKLRSSLQDSDSHEELIKEAFNFNYLKLEPNLQFLFLNLINLALSKKSVKMHKLNLIDNILERISPDIHPVIFAPRFLFNDITTNWANAIKRCIEEIGKNYQTSPRYYYNLHNFIMIVSRVGQLEPYLDFYKKLDATSKNFEKFMQLVSLQETDPFLDTIGLYNQIKDIPEIKSSVYHYEIKVKYIIRELIKKEVILSDEELQEKGVLLQKNVINANISLLNNNPKIALQYTRNSIDVDYDDTFLSKTAIRVELANGNLKTAKLLVIKDSQKRFDLMEDFYFAQISLLEGNKSAAQAYMSKLNQTVEKYKAHNLLDLEFKLAPHLTMSQIRFLTKAEVLPNKNNISLLANVSNVVKEVSAKIMGSSNAITSVKKLIKQYADLDQAVLIQGETGTGKELIAQLLHEQSKRAKKPFLAINCASILGTVLQSEFFGHESGSFTGAQKAHKGIFEAGEDGTVFLDEIGEISPEIQVSLLRVLEAKEIRPVGSVKTKPIHCRIIAATNAHLQDLVKKGTFRSDLYYRLQRLEIQSPPLRERGDDIILLANHFLNSFFPQVTGPVKMDAQLENALLQYDWPGNIRELKNEMEKMRLKNADKEIYELSDATFLLKNESTNELKPVAKSIVPEKSNETPSIKNTDDFTHFNYKSQFRRIEKLKEKFLQHERISREEAGRLLGISSKTIGEDFKLLQKEGFIEKIEPTKSPRTHYFILKKHRL